MKVLHVIDSGGLYGAEIMLLNLVDEQLKAGLSPMILSIGHPGQKEKPFEIEAGKRNLPLTIMRFRNGLNFKGAVQIVKFARNQDFQILHSHGYKGNILLGLLPRKFRQLPMVSTLHGWTAARGLTTMRIYESLDAISLRFVDKVVLVNSAMLKHPRINRQKLDIEIVENGLPVKENQAETLLDSAIVSFCRGGRTFCAIGRLSKEKGFDVLLRAFKVATDIIPGIRLLLIGEGRERNNLMSLIDELDLNGSLLLAGYHDSAYRYLKYCKSLVISSYTEGLPIVLLEALREGAHVISTNVGGIPGVLNKTGGGTLVPPGDINRLAAAIVDVCEKKDTDFSEIEKIRGRFKKYYSAEVMQKNYNLVYSSL